MPRSKRSISLPHALALAVEREAARTGTTFSAWLAQTAAHQLRLDAGRRAVAAWEREHGPLTEAERAEGLARARRVSRRTKRQPLSRRSA